jgi:hypothetical protein
MNATPPPTRTTKDMHTRIVLAALLLSSSAHARGDDSPARVAFGAAMFVGVAAVVATAWVGLALAVESACGGVPVSDEEFEQQVAEARRGPS